MVDKKEIHEARAVAYEVLGLLQEVEKQLKSARNWGIYDLLGGGFFSSWIKHGKIDKADALLRRVSEKLHELQKELGDIHLGLDSRVDISGFQRFVDIAFDNIVFDWITQTKIQDSLSEVARVSTEVRQVISTLDQIERDYGQ